MRHVSEMEKRTERALDKMNARLKRQKEIRKRLDETFKPSEEDSENVEKEEKEDYSFIKLPYHPDEEEREQMINAMPKHLRDVMKSFEEKNKQLKLEEEAELEAENQDENEGKLITKRTKKSTSMDDLLSQNADDETSTEKNEKPLSIQDAIVEAMKKLKHVAKDLDEENGDVDADGGFSHKEDVFGRNKRELSEQEIEKEIIEQRKKDLKVNTKILQYTPSNSICKRPNYGESFVQAIARMME